jgi:hypothetical protein
MVEVAPQLKDKKRVVAVLLSLPSGFGELADGCCRPLYRRYCPHRDHKPGR